MSDSTVRSSRPRKFLTLGAGAGLAAVSLLSLPVAHAAPSPATASCPAVNGVDKETITLGAVLPKTGAAATTFAGFDASARLRLDQENAKGGVNGRKFKLVVVDDKNDGATQSQVATKLLQEDKVFGILVGSSITTMMPMLNSAGVPVIGLSSAVGAFPSANGFGASGTSDPTWAANAPVLKLKSLGLSKVGMIAHNTSQVQNIVATFHLVIASVPGMESVIRMSDLPQGSYDATGAALRIKQSGAQGLQGNFSPAGIVSTLQGLNQQGVKITGIWPGLTDPTLIAQAGAAAEGQIAVGYGTTPIQLTKIPAVRTFANGMRAAGLNPNNSSAPLGYVAADLFIKGLRLAGPCPTNSSFISKLRGVSSYDANGLLPGPINFTPGVTPYGNPPKCNWYLTVKSGQLVPDAKPTCGQLVNLKTGEVQ